MNLVDLAYSSHDGTPLFTTVLQNPDIPRTPAITTLDLRAGVRLNGFDVSIFAKNLLNGQPEIVRYEDLPAANYFRGITLRPRTIGITATFRN